LFWVVPPGGGVARQGHRFRPIGLIRSGECCQAEGAPLPGKEWGKKEVFGRKQEKPLSAR